MRNFFSAGACMRRFVAPLFGWLLLVAGVGSGYGQGLPLPYYYSNGQSGEAARPPFPAATELPPVTIPPPQFASYPTVTLDQCVQAAHSLAPNILVANATLASASAQFTQVRAKNGLTVAANGSYVHADNLPGVGATQAISSIVPSQLASGATSLGDNVGAGLSLSGPSTSVDLSAHHLSEAHTLPSNDQVTALGASGSQTLFDGYLGGRAAATVAQANDTYRSAQVTYDATLLTAIYQVKQDYYTLLGDQNTVRSDQASVVQYTQNLKLLQAELAAQLATSLDVLQAQITLRQAELAVQAAESTVETDRKNLSLAIGWPLDKTYQVADVTAPSLPATSEAQALKIAYENRPELKTLALDLAAARVNLALQKAQFFPVVSATGSANLFEDSTTGTNSGTYTAGASISTPVFEGGLLRAQVQAANDQLQSLAVQEEQERHSIAIAVDSALFNVNNAREQLDLAGQSVQAAQGQYGLERSKLAVGLATNLDVLTALAALTTTQGQLVQAETGYSLAVLNLINVVGR